MVTGGWPAKHGPPPPAWCRLWSEGRDAGHWRDTGEPWPGTGETFGQEPPRDLGLNLGTWVWAWGPESGPVVLW